MGNTIPGPDGRPRCRWCSAAPEFFDYHDNEWGFPVSDDQRLLKDAGIVRHRGKIEAVINNARRALEMVARYGSLAAYFWRFEPASGKLARPQTVSASAESLALSKALKKQGWKFVGPTTVYAFMQAMGLDELLEPLQSEPRH